LGASIPVPLEWLPGEVTPGLELLRLMAEYRCSLLIVDDEPHVLASLTACLQREFAVVSAGSADEALEILRARDFDLLLTDQRMPGMSGVELLDWVRKHRPKMIRLLMTGYAEFEDVVDAINRGQIFRFLLKPWRLNELVETLQEAARVCKLERSHEHLLQEVRRLNTELELRIRQKTMELEDANRQLHQRNLMLERLALTDDLTGLPNRRAIDQILQSEVRRRSRYPSTLALGLIDADHFKEVNTQYLYPGGDHVLASLARVLTTSIRGMDTVGRVGGEEFVVIAPITDLDGARNLGERIRHAVANNIVRYQGNDIRVTVSVGMAVAEPDMHLPAEQFMYEAAVALGEAKAGGRNCCVTRALANSVHEAEAVGQPA
jgi:diguanylate cyclase